MRLDLIYSYDLAVRWLFIWITMISFYHRVDGLVLCPLLVFNSNIADGHGESTDWISHLPGHI